MGAPIRSEVESLVRDEVRDIIPRSHWLNYEIEPHGFINGSENFRISTQRLNTAEDRRKGAYCDLCVDKRLFSAWLPTEGARLLAESRAKWKRVPLVDAAKILYEQTRGFFLSGIVDYQKTEDEKIQWLSNMMAQRVPIWGCKNPGRFPEKIQNIGKQYHIHIYRGNACVRDGGQNVIFEEISVLNSDLLKAIENVKEGGREADA